MKTDEQILLNYMYMDGYTDEEMHDPETLKIVRKSFLFAVHLVGVRVKAVVQEVGESLREAFNKISEKLAPFAAWFDELREPDKTEPLERKVRTPVYFQDKTMRRLQHQVIDRKPRHIVRKIIK